MDSRKRVSRYVYGDDLYTYRGITYCPEDEFEEDNVKRFHSIVIIKDGIRCDIGSVPMSPYSVLSEERFQRWIQMGRPTRDQMGGHHHQDHDRYWRKIFDEALDNILLGKDSGDN